eukprot:COSAG02_NODE_34538_length_482_cov_1.198433_1_plen_122_part_00
MLYFVFAFCILHFVKPPASLVDGAQPVVIDQSTAATKSASPMDESQPATDQKTTTADLPAAANQTASAASPVDGAQPVVIDLCTHQRWLVRVNRCSESRPVFLFESQPTAPMLSSSYPPYP